VEEDAEWVFWNGVGGSVEGEGGGYDRVLWG